jgi:arginase
MRNISLLGIPVYTLTKNYGIGLAVRSLRDLGIAQTLEGRFDHVRDFGDVTLPTLTKDEGAPNLRNYPHFLASTDAIFNTTKKLPAEGTVFCLGGECGLILGGMAGFRHNFVGQPGLLWIDAHGDFNTPETTQSGFIGGMPLAFVCGHGPKFNPEVENLRPLIREYSVVHVGGRDFDTLESNALKESQMKLYSSSSFRTNGTSRTAVKMADQLADQSDWITCHLDIDALDPSIVSAVNFPSPRGLTLEEIRIIVEALSQTEKLKVFNLAGYNSTLDKNQASARTILDLISCLSL